MGSVIAHIPAPSSRDCRALCGTIVNNRTTGARVGIVSERSALVRYLPVQALGEGLREAWSVFVGRRGAVYGDLVASPS